MKKYIYRGLVMAFAVAISSCTTEDLEPTLAQSKSVEESVNKVDNLFSILKGIHSILSTSGYYGQDVIITNEVRSDNAFSNGGSGRYTTESQYVYNNNSDLIWNNAYEVIANTNIIINADVESLEGDVDYGRHIQGQATAIRALAHFDLLREYGQQHTGNGNLGVPIVTEYKGEDLFPARNTIDEVKAAIYSDLETAFSMMDAQYDNTNVYISKYAAKALESRVAVYFGDWSRAVSAAEEVINSGLYSIVPADNFVSSWTTDGGPNIIFELAASQVDNAGINGLAYIYQINDDGSGYGDVTATSELLGIYEASDVRLGVISTDGDFIRNVGKYPDNVNFTDNIPLIRYEEVVLNYAEALLETGGDALTELNKLPANRGASLYTEATKENIILERRKELAFEGFRYDDQLRVGMDMEARGTDGGVIEVINYPSYLFAWPIPLSEMNANSNMVQNDGY
ncbi:RagB/SusD family nutrient uptake outer membrane protein [Gramella jeungdoensis]|uniref:RagB/SusD family nutrient uptake outer membrane protein n=1 Tax=Gramella jeungdoensis TaxID=708091 RepID=A0ABT0Z6F8_9FLAO|nr:RagB/SusD family nutrient uptake outer membrane protein [Gramella jeungdoensis]MCM8571000.1 RagB/SusD family nutrient uptake outer membrane protein [Gramella jeungdoensis]